MRRLTGGLLATAILASGAGRADAGLIVESIFPVNVSPGLLDVPAGGFTSPVDFAGGPIHVGNSDPIPYSFLLSYEVVVESEPSQRVGSVTTFLTGPLLIGAAPPGGGATFQGYPVSFTLDAATLNAAVSPGDTQLHVFLGRARLESVAPVPEPSTLATGGIGLLAGGGVAWRRRKRAE